MVELQKICTSTAEHPRNLSTHCIVEISLIMHSIHVILRNQGKIIFYVNNYIDWSQFNQLYTLDWLEKSVQNADVVAQKLIPASSKTTDLKREEAKKK